MSAALLVFALVSPSLTPFAQEAQRPATRPRRATQTDAWPTPTPEAVTLPQVEPPAPNLKSEPLVRIGLTTNARSVTVSTDGRLLDATDANVAPVPFEVARVRIEPRSYTPPPALDANADANGVETAAASSKTFPRATPSSSTPPARAPSNPEATTRGTLSRAGAPTPKASGTSASNAPAAKTGVQLTSRASAPVRGAALYAPGTTRPLLDVRAPVLFASDDPERSPVRYNEKAYRGRLEVFANSRGSLTVVNVVALEDYVRGVVPNELSPGGWPELEALKAQAVAARTYAVSNLGRFASEGYDLTPDTRSQVYGGRSTEHPLTDRAVSETRGRVATYAGRPINALYTSTCGGRTEDAENIFGGEAPAYLRGRECALESGEHFAPYTVRTTRELPSVKLAEHAAAPRDAALLSVHGFSIPSRLTDEWLAAPLTADESGAMFGRVATLAGQPAPFVSADSTRPAGFATALALALDGESRGAVLLNSADVSYTLSFRDADDVPDKSRADVAAMLREGHLSLFPDGTLRPKQPLSRARALRSVAHALEARGLLRLQKAAARPSTKEALVLRPTSGKDLNVKVSAGVYLFAGFGEGLYAVRELNIVGGESVVTHTDASGEIDYLEARPAPGGAAADHYSPFANWAENLTPGGVLSRIQRAAAGVGQLLDVRVRRRGVSGRVLDLELLGTEGTAHIRGGRIRSALGLREQLFVVDRVFDENGRVARFKFTGRGWGHGVGLCQVGAYGMARAGLSYEKILKSYYTGVSLTKLY
ncbi:MAG TPA: SpoIID/LytB domain-containing protein [Pyrinomonadaceae bacterium]|nr:SpoIID/LytB domain-containing protein [Pyrinomonadaceae bacterium]